MMLTMEASTVVMLRSAALVTGGEDARAETQLMVGEKLVANAVAASVLMNGGSLQSVIAGYREVIDANTRRLLNSH